MCGSGEILGGKTPSSAVISFCEFERMRLIPFCFDRRDEEAGDSDLHGAG
ncbi:MAG: hypothetical protein LBT81_06005 [Helicobacteraceae bacterium]|nr:hypothetical protein [Helicobacteraceae bacterium]